MPKFVVHSKVKGTDWKVGEVVALTKAQVEGEFATLLRPGVLEPLPAGIDADPEPDKGGKGKPEKPEK